MADAAANVQMVKVTIDGVEVSVPKGTFALEAAKKAGIYISNMCAHPDVRPFGACRLCTVGVVSKWGFDFEISCAFECKDGAVMFTENANEEVREVKKFILEALLIDHPLDCPICPASGACDLQNATWHYGMTENRMAREKDWNQQDYLSQAIMIKRDRCVLCGQCVRVCEELVGATALAFVNRGIETFIDTAWGNDLTKATACTSCGLCVEVCPVGSLMHVQYESTGLQWTMKRTSTTCNYCATGCQMNFEAEANTGLIEKVTFNEQAGVGDSRSCVRGRYGYQYINSKDRLKMPLLRKGNDFVEISWKQAYDEILKKLPTYTGDQFGAIASGKLTNEENYLLQKFSRGLMKSNNIDSPARFTQSAGILAQIEQFGLPGMTNTIHDIKDYAGCYLFAGTDPENSNPVISYQWQESIARRHVKVILVNPRHTRWVDRSAMWLKIKPGTDAALYNGLAYVMVKEGLVDADFISNRTEGYDALRSSLNEFTPERVSQITGVSASDIILAARMFATGGNNKKGKDGKYPASSIVYGTGVTQWNNGIENVQALGNLALLTGNMGRIGGGLNGLAQQANDQGAADQGCLPDFLPGFVPVGNDQYRAALETAWFGKADGSIPSKPGLKYLDIFKAAEAGQIKMLYIAGENPLVTAPDLQLVKRGLEKAEFVIVQDIFMTETARYANLILPAGGHAEKDGSFTNTERRINRIRKAVATPGLAKPDWKILVELMDRPGFNNKFKNPSEIMDEIAKVNRLYKGVTYAKLDRSKTIMTYKPGLLFPGADYSRMSPYTINRMGVQWPVTTEGSAEDGTPVLFANAFSTANGKAKLLPVRFQGRQYGLTKEFPLLLSVGRALHSNDRSGTMSRRNYVLETLDPEPDLEINPKDAQQLGIEDGDIVKVTSAFGSLEIKAKVTDHQPVSQVFMPWMFREAPGFAITSRTTDPRTGTPELKATPVSVQFLRKSLSGLLNAGETAEVITAR